MKKEEGKIINLREYANTSSTEEFKGKVENDYTKEILNKMQKRKEEQRRLKKASIKRWGAGILATAILAGIVAGVRAAKENETKPIETMPTEYTENINAISEEISTIQGVKDDFVEKYLEAYNEKYATQYKDGIFVVKPLKEGAVYQMADGRIVTRGSKPYETEDALKKIGNFEMINNQYKYDSVFQVIATNGKVLGTYSTTTGEFIYSGNQIEDLENSKFEKTELESLGINPDKAKRAAEVVKANGVEGKDSINARIKSYNKTPFELIPEIQKEDTTR